LFFDSAASYYFIQGKEIFFSSVLNFILLRSLNEKKETYFSIDLISKFEMDGSLFEFTILDKDVYGVTLILLWDSLALSIVSSY